MSAPSVLSLLLAASPVCTMVVSPSPLPATRAAVIVPGFLSSSNDFAPMAAALTSRGIPATVVPFPLWAWIPCLGGRSMRPVLERVEHAVRHVASNPENPSVPAVGYGLTDLWEDFWRNPGGVREVGGSAEPDEYPEYAPRGQFPPAPSPRGRVILIGHSKTSLRDPQPYAHD